MTSEITKYAHWNFSLDKDNYCWLTIDVADKSTNVLTREVLDELREIIPVIEQQKPQALLIQSGKTNGFIAGADITSFTTITTQEEALHLIRQGQDIFTMIENLSFTTISLINGFCLGGGLELALACDYRIAIDEPKTKIGLPEVKLGIHPGFGGTVRLIQLIGAPAALPLLLSGKILAARQAAKLGIVTHAVPPRLLRSAARKTITKGQKHARKSLSKLADSAPARPLVAMLARKKLKQRVNRIHYPAPFAMLELWEKHGGSPTKMMTQEAQSVSKLIRTPTAQNLIRVFQLQEKLKSLPADIAFTPQHVHVIGAGVMGGDIAAWCALQGFKVSIQDNSHAILAKTVKRAVALFQKKLRAPHLVKAVLDRFIPDMNGICIPKADVIIEAIYEDVNAKKELFLALEPRMRPDTLLATNTSSIPLETLAADLNNPEKLVGLHFFNPVAKMMLVEVVSTSYVAETDVLKAISFTKKIGKLPLPVQSSPGFLINRILMPYLHEAALLESEGIPPLAIDKAAEQFGMPVGPIELMDLVGLDICQSVAEFMANDPTMKMPANVQKLLNQGRLGKKSGAGYYTYTKNKPDKPSFDKKMPLPGDIADRLTLRLINESVACLREKVVADGDLLDAGMIFGTGFAPFRGGVIHYMHEQSPTTLLSKMQQLATQYGERFAPDQGWETV